MPDTKTAYHELPAYTGPKPAQARREMVKALYLSGLSIRQTALEVGITPQAVQSMLDRMGVPRRPAGGNTGSHSRHRR